MTYPKGIFFFITLFFIMFLSACSSQNASPNEIEKPIEESPYYDALTFHKNGTLIIGQRENKYCLVDIKTKKRIGSLWFDSLQATGSSLAIGKMNGNYVLVDVKTGTLCTKDSYSQISCIDENCGGYYYMAQDKETGKYWLLNRDGLIVEQTYDNVINFIHADMNGTYAVVENKGLQGLIGLESETVIAPCQYKKLVLYRMRNGHILVDDGSQYMKICFSSGKPMIIPFQDVEGIIDALQGTTDGRIRVQKASGWGMRHDRPNSPPDGLTIPCQYDEINLLPGELTECVKNGLKTYYNSIEEIIGAEGKYDAATPLRVEKAYRTFSCNFCAVRDTNTGLWGVITLQGNTILSCAYEAILDTNNAVYYDTENNLHTKNLGFLVQKDGEQMIVDENGKIIIPPQHYEEITFLGNLYGVKKNGQWALLREDGTPLGIEGCECIIQYDLDGLDDTIHFAKGLENLHYLVAKYPDTCEVLDVRGNILVEKNRYKDVVGPVFEGNTFWLEMRLEENPVLVQQKEGWKVITLTELLANSCSS